MVTQAGTLGRRAEKVEHRAGPADFPSSVIVWKRTYGAVTLCAIDRDRGAPHDAAPPTPPGIRVTYLGGSIGLSFSMQPGFRVLSSSGPVRPFGRNPFLRCQSYSPLPIVRAFVRRFRLGLSVAPPFGLECLTSLADSTAYYALC